MNRSTCKIIFLNVNLISIVHNTFCRATQKVPDYYYYYYFGIKKFNLKKKFRTLYVISILYETSVKKNLHKKKRRRPKHSIHRGSSGCMARGRSRRWMRAEPAARAVAAPSFWLCLPLVLRGLQWRRSGDRWQMRSGCNRGVYSPTRSGFGSVGCCHGRVVFLRWDPYTANHHDLWRLGGVVVDCRAGPPCV